MALFGKSGSAIDDEVKAVKAGGDELFLSGFFVEVTGDLKLCKVIVGEVFVKGLDDPVAVGRVVAEVVVVVAVGVGDADEVEPEFCHVLAVSGLGHEAVDEFGVGVGRGVGEELADLIKSRREAGEVEREAPNEGAFIGFLFW